MTIIERLPLIEDLAPDSRVSGLSPASPAKITSAKITSDDIDVERVIWDSEYRARIVRMLNASKPD